MKTITLSICSLLLLTSLLFAPIISMASEPDFYIIFDECKTVVGSTLQNDYPLQSLQGTPSSYACKRLEKEFNCLLQFKGGEASALGGNAHTYDLTFETSGIFMMTLPGGGDQISVNQVTHTAVIVTKLSSEKMFGAKVCKGKFFTSDEANALEKLSEKSQDQ